MPNPYRQYVATHQKELPESTVEYAQWLASLKQGDKILLNLSSATYKKLAIHEITRTTPKRLICQIHPNYDVQINKETGSIIGYSYHYAQPVHQKALNKLIAIDDVQWINGAKFTPAQAAKIRAMIEQDQKQEQPE